MQSVQIKIEPGKEYVITSLRNNTPIFGDSFILHQSDESKDLYFVECKSDGKYWDIAGSSQSNGGKLLTWSKHGGANQQFQFVHISGNQYKIKAQHSQKFVTCSNDNQITQNDLIEDTNHSQHFALEMLDEQKSEDFDDTVSDLEKLQLPVDGIYYVQPCGGLATNRVLLNCSANGEKINLTSKDDNSGRQQWLIRRVAEWPIQNKCTYYIFTRRSLDSDSDMIAVNKQAYLVENISENYFLVQGTESKDYWDIAGGSRQSGAKLCHWWQRHERGNQQFAFLNLGDGWCKIKVKISGKYLTYHDKDVSITQEDWTNDPCQYFKFRKYSDQNKVPFYIESLNGLGLDSGLLTCVNNDDGKMSALKLNASQLELRQQQTWIFQYNKIANFYHIKTLNDRFLSAWNDGSEVDIYTMDDRTGHQQWKLHLIEFIDTQIYDIENEIKSSDDIDVNNINLYDIATIFYGNKWNWPLIQTANDNIGPLNVSRELILNIPIFKKATDSHLINSNEGSMSYHVDNDEKSTTKTNMNTMQTALEAALSKKPRNGENDDDEERFCTRNTPIVTLLLTLAYFINKILLFFVGNFENMSVKFNERTLDTRNKIKDPGTVLGIATQESFDANKQVFYWYINDNFEVINIVLYWYIYYYLSDHAIYAFGPLRYHYFDFVIIISSFLLKHIYNWFMSHRHITSTCEVLIHRMLLAFKEICSIAAVYVIVIQLEQFESLEDILSLTNIVFYYMLLCALPNWIRCIHFPFITSILPFINQAEMEYLKLVLNSNLIAEVQNADNDDEILHRDRVGIDGDGSGNVNDDATDKKSYKYNKKTTVLYCTGVNLHRVQMLKLINIHNLYNIKVGFNIVNSNLSTLNLLNTNLRMIKYHKIDNLFPKLLSVALLDNFLYIRECITNGQLPIYNGKEFSIDEMVDELSRQSSLTDLWAMLELMKLGQSRENTLFFIFYILGFMLDIDPRTGHIRKSSDMATDQFEEFIKFQILGRNEQLEHAIGVLNQYFTMERNHDRKEPPTDDDNQNEYFEQKDNNLDEMTEYLDQLYHALQSLQFMKQKRIYHFIEPMLRNKLRESFVILNLNLKKLFGKYYFEFTKSPLHSASPIQRMLDDDPQKLVAMTKDFLRHLCTQTQALNGSIIAYSLLSTVYLIRSLIYSPDFHWYWNRCCYGNTSFIVDADSGKVIYNGDTSTLPQPQRFLTQQWILNRHSNLLKKKNNKDKPTNDEDNMLIQQRRQDLNRWLLHFTIY